MHLASATSIKKVPKQDSASTDKKEPNSFIKFRLVLNNALQLVGIRLDFRTSSSLASAIWNSNLAQIQSKYAFFVRDINLKYNKKTINDGSWAKDSSKYGDDGLRYQTMTSVFSTIPHKDLSSGEEFRFGKILREYNLNNDQIRGVFRNKNLWNPTVAYWRQLENDNSYNRELLQEDNAESSSVNSKGEKRMRNVEPKIVNNNNILRKEENSYQQQHNCVKKQSDEPRYISNIYEYSTQTLRNEVNSFNRDNIKSSSIDSKGEMNNNIILRKEENAYQKRLNCVKKQSDKSQSISNTNNFYGYPTETLRSEIDFFNKELLQKDIIKSSNVNSKGEKMKQNVEPKVVNNNNILRKEENADQQQQTCIKKQSEELQETTLFFKMEIDDDTPTMRKSDDDCQEIDEIIFEMAAIQAGKKINKNKTKHANLESSNFTLQKTQEVAQVQTKCKSEQINQKNSFTSRETQEKITQEKITLAEDKFKQTNFLQEIYTQTQEIQEKDDFKKRKKEKQVDDSEMEMDIDYKINEIDEEMILLEIKRKKLEVEKRIYELSIEKSKLKRKRDT